MSFEQMSSSVIPSVVLMEKTGESHSWWTLDISPIDCIKYGLYR